MEQVPSAEADSACSTWAFPALPRWAFLSCRYAADVILLHLRSTIESFETVFEQTGENGKREIVGQKLQGITR